jgi:AcrR family transcriptional regulator
MVPPLLSPANVDLFGTVAVHARAVHKNEPFEGDSQHLARLDRHETHRRRHRQGTVYLHWNTREELFRAVFEREVLQAIRELLQALRQAPQVCLLHRFARAYFLAIMNRPLLRGFVLGDPDLLGRLAKPRGTARDDRHRLMSRTYFALLAKHGLLRDDLDVDAIAYACQATFEGFLRAEAEAVDATPTTTGHAAASLDQRADLLARTVQRAFESARTIPHRMQQSLATAAIDLLTDLINAERAGLGIAEA